ncbi:transposase [Escherichia sp. SP-MK]
MPSFAQSIKKTIGCSVEIIKRSELHKFVVLSKRWIVEGTFAWLENYRRLWKNCERTLENSRQSCILAGVAFLLEKF